MRSRVSSRAAFSFRSIFSDIAPHDAFVTGYEPRAVAGVPCRWARIRSEAIILGAEGASTKLAKRRARSNLRARTASVHGFAAVDVEDMAGDVGSFIGCDEDD